MCSSHGGNYNTPAIKQFKMLRPYIITDGDPRPFIDMRVDYDVTPPHNQPDVTFTAAGTEWDTGSWDTADWAAGAVMQSNWSGTAAFGTVGAPRLTAIGAELRIRRLRLRRDL